MDDDLLRSLRFTGQAGVDGRIQVRRRFARISDGHREVSSLCQTSDLRRIEEPPDDQHSSTRALFLARQDRVGRDKEEAITQSKQAAGNSHLSINRRRE